MVVWEALDALSREFELCKIGTTSRVVVLVDPAISTERIELVRAALARTGATSVEIRATGQAMAPGKHPLVVAALRDTHVVITTGADMHAELHGEGRRVLHLPDIDPTAFPPHASLRQRSRALHASLANGRLLTMTDAHGSELRIELSGGKFLTDHGFLSDDTRASRFPAGWAGVVPAGSSVSGELVIMPGDANLGATRLLSSPVRLQVLDDHVTQIHGDSPDADVIRALFEYAGDPNAYGISELTVGMNPGAAPTRVFDDRLLDPITSRLLAGTVTLSFGNNPVADRPCGQTIAFALPGRSVTVDELVVTTHGQLFGDFAPDVYEL